MIISTQKITYDTDDGRPNNTSSLIVDSSGRTVIFYEKTFTSGRTSDSRTTATLPFQVNVQAGTGTINGISVVWSSATLSATPDSFQLIYVDQSGTVGVTTGFTMHSMKDWIVLAYVSTGVSAISYVEEVEKAGDYIYVRKQIDVGGQWEWDDTETVLNTGESPRAFYSAADDKIYLSYRKDSIAYLRVFDFTNPFTWDYLPNYVVSALNQINMNRDPENKASTYVGSAYGGGLSLLNAQIYGMTSTGFGYIDNGSGYQPYIFLPMVTSSYGYLGYMLFPYYVEIFEKVGEAYILQESVPVYSNIFGDYRWHLWTGSYGKKYIGIRVMHTVYIGDYITDISGYQEIDTFPPFEYFTLVGDTYNGQIIDGRNELRISSSGYNGDLSFPQVFDFFIEFQEDPTQDMRVSSGYGGTLSFPFEYEAFNEFQQDTTQNMRLSSGYAGYLSIVTT